VLIVIFEIVCVALVAGFLRFKLLSTRKGATGIEVFGCSFAVSYPCQGGDSEGVQQAASSKFGRDGFI